MLSGSRSGIEAALGAAFARGARAHAGLRCAPAYFRPHALRAAERLAREAPCAASTAGPHIEQIHAEDLYLASACHLKSPGAWEQFGSQVKKGVAGYLERRRRVHRRLAREVADDVPGILLARELPPEAGPLGGYSAHEPLIAYAAGVGWQHARAEIRGARRRTRREGDLAHRRGSDAPRSQPDAALAAAQAHKALAGILNEVIRLHGPLAAALLAPQRLGGPGMAAAERLSGHSRRWLSKVRSAALRHVQQRAGEVGLDLSWILQQTGALRVLAGDLDLQLRLAWEVAAAELSTEQP